jgi:hypothetical protein
MTADLSRTTFDPFKHFSRVLMQQGRVQLDADWNEQAAILLRYLQALAVDLIGPHGGPITKPGFAIGPLTLTPPVSGDFRIGLGRYYVDGILCEVDSRPVGFSSSTHDPNTIQVDQWTLDGAAFQPGQLVEVYDDVDLANAQPSFAPTLVQIATTDPAELTLMLVGAPAFGTPGAPKLRRVVTYLSQLDYPVPSAALLATASTALVYVDVWERVISAVEDGSIREVALGGPDTACRGRIVWQVKVLPGRVNPDSSSPCDNFTPTDPCVLTNLLAGNRGHLKARAKQTTSWTDPCSIAPDARYTGPENQLYRIEIHRSGAAWDGTDDGRVTAATFKWSRVNGSVVFPIQSLTSHGSITAVVLREPGRDARLDLATGDWVEMVDDNSVLQNRTDSLLQVQAVDPGRLSVTLSGTSKSGVGSDATRHPLLRRWDGRASDASEGGLELGSDSAALLIEGTDGAWLDLEHGVQVQFQPAHDGQITAHYRSGDYWLIPARTATTDVEWPTETGRDSQGNATVVPLAKEPDGIDHHFAPLGAVLVDSSGMVSVVSDCRRQFSPVGHS